MGATVVTAYDYAFYDYINRGSARSALTVVPLMSKIINVDSVVDFGCGQGAWLRQWKRSGAKEVLGLDGDYVNREALLIENSEFKKLDLSGIVDLGRKFDLVQSLEVAEHVRESSADTFVENLVRHGDLILFSAAPVGQGGHDHVNEQPYEYWRDKFLKYDYILVDWLRTAVKDAPEVESWYRYNSFIFVRRTREDLLPPDIIAYRIPDTAPVVDVSPVAYKLRKRVISRLPRWACYLLAQAKKYAVLASRQLRAEA
jgi:hypothetical protein